MDSNDLEGLIFIVLVGGLLLFVWAYREWTRRSFEEAATNDRRCVACDSTAVRVTGPGLYICAACGYEGGSGRGQLEASQRAASWASRPLVQRVAGARADLVSAYRTLMSVEAEASQLEEADLGLLSSQGMVHARREEGQGARQVVIRAFWEASRQLTAAAEKIPELAAPEPVLALEELDPEGLRAARSELASTIQHRLELLERVELGAA